MSDQEKLLQAEIRRLQLEQIKFLEAEIARKEALPHLYGWKWYKWARKFFESTNKETFLLAGNQLSKSSTQIRKAIHWATDKTIWPKLWPHLTPNQFWYLYPNRDTATIEFHTKWKQFLPKNKDCPIYGWHEEIERKHIKAIHFNSGVSVYFKTYSQDAEDLQSGTVYAIFTDEELPLPLLGELQARLNATDGYFSMVFTATIGQDYWRRAMEPRFKEEETHPDALKIQVSLYDCLEYEDGTKSHWTLERIERIKRKCSTDQEVQVRVYGKFAKLGGRKFDSYDDVANRTDPHPLPSNWHIYSGVDIGSGGETGHPSAIVFVAVDPMFRKGRIFKAWRGDGIKTTAGSTYEKYVELRGDLKPVLQCYDWASADFKTIAESAGDSFEAAYKKKTDGIGLMNTLFKAKMLAVQHGDPELDKLSSELMDLSEDSIVSDDLCFAGETLISTSCGEIPIEDISIGDMVLTRKGYRRVLAKTIALSYAINLNHDDGSVTWVTKDHNYITPEGNIKAKDLSGKICLGLSTKDQQKFSSLKELNTEGTQSQNTQLTEDTLAQAFITNGKAIGRSIKKYGCLLMAKFQRAAIFTILMKMFLITRLRTLIALMVRFISPCICKLKSVWLRAVLICSEYIKCQMPLLTPVVRKIKGGLNRFAQFLGSAERLFRRSVSYVGQALLLTVLQPINLSFARMRASQPIEEVSAWMTSKKLVLSVRIVSKSISTEKQSVALENVRLSPGDKRKLCLVYNITVDGEHEYFANGVLVANCSALRYAISKIPWDFSALDGLPVEPVVHKKELTDLDFRRGITDDSSEIGLEEEFDEWNEMYNA